ncbi:MAG: DUF1573 domain-containing protein [Bacteroidales bacterium]|nr:DUF1573 domain-containing protein [Bacteroidales bacterium]
MKKIKILLLITISFLAPCTIYPQSGKAVIKFRTMQHDFGEIEENKGPVSTEFVFSNEGTLPLVLGSVIPTCGCTSPEWTKQPIMPGKLGSINVKFDPRNRPGPFSKSIKVNSNAENPVVILTIKGNVKSGGNSPAELRFSIGGLKLQNIHAAFGTVLKGNVQKKSIEVMNGLSDTPLTVSFKKVQPHIAIEMKPSTLNPGERGVIEIEFNSNKLDDWDYNVNRIEILINNQQHKDNLLTATAVVKEDFSKLTPEDLLKAPRISFDTEKINFGTMPQNKKTEFEYTLTNTGSSDLMIRKVRASCGCTAVEPETNIIAPGKSAKIKAVFNSSGKSGSQRYTITVISNDPKRYKKILWLEGNVIKD